MTYLGKVTRQAILLAEDDDFGDPFVVVLVGQQSRLPRADLNLNG